MERDELSRLVRSFAGMHAQDFSRMRAALDRELIGTPHYAAALASISNGIESLMTAARAIEAGQAVMVRPPAGSASSSDLGDLLNGGTGASR